MPAGGGVAGQPVNAYLVGRRRFVLVDPGDPTGPALDRAIALAAERGGTIEAIALTHADPDHAAGAEALAERLGIPVVAGPGAGRLAAIRRSARLADLETLTETRRPADASSGRPGRGPTTWPSSSTTERRSSPAISTGSVARTRSSGRWTRRPWRPRATGSTGLAPAAVRLPGHPPV